jgi:hypothetical protein
MIKQLCHGLCGMAYGPIWKHFWPLAQQNTAQAAIKCIVNAGAMMAIEPTLFAWEARVLLLNDTLLWHDDSRITI